MLETNYNYKNEIPVVLSILAGPDCRLSNESCSSRCYRSFLTYGVVLEACWQLTICLSLLRVILLSQLKCCQSKDLTYMCFMVKASRLTQVSGINKTLQKNKYRFEWECSAYTGLTIFGIYHGFDHDIDGCLWF